MENVKTTFRKRVRLTIIIQAAFILIFLVVSAGGLYGQTVDTQMTPEKAGVMKFGLLAAALAFGLGAIGAGIAIANVGSSAMGAIAEKPEIANQALLFIALAEGLAIFGFITALMILGKI